MNALQRRGRVAAAVGGLVAAGAATVMVLAGTASAAEQGRCTDNVNVRSQPSASASVVTVCRRGTDVTIGERRNGFVQLTNLNGWAAEQYVSGGARSTTPSSSTSAGRAAAPTTTTKAAAPTSARSERTAPTSSAAAPRSTHSAPAPATTSPSARSAPAAAAPADPAPAVRDGAPADDESAPAPADAAAPAAPLGGLLG